MCREFPLWYPRARDGAATVCSMARARLPKARVGASDETSKWELQNLFPTGVAREEFRWYRSLESVYFIYLSRTIDGETRVRYVNPFTVRDSRFRSSFPFRDFS